MIVKRTVFVTRLLPISASFRNFLLQRFPILVGFNKQTGELTAFSSTLANLGTLQFT
jgi:hypothetical protein